MVPAVTRAGAASAGTGAQRRVTDPFLRASETDVADHLDFTDAYPELFVLAERAAKRILHDAAAAEDVAAETMARALASWGKVSTYSRPWVTRVAVNRAIDVVRRDRSAPGEREGDTGNLERERVPGAATDEAVMDRLGLVAALARLSSRQREAVALRYVVGLDDIETAAVLGVGVETARSHVRRGLTRLRLELSDPEELRHAAR